MASIDDDPIELVPSKYDSWRNQFVAERNRILSTLATSGLEPAVHRIEHVGSTAVPDLAAKDIVDLDIVVADGSVRDVSQVLEATLGGGRVENSEYWHPVFRRQDGQRFNDHVVGASSDTWKISVVTRDVLCARPDLCTEYEQLKRDLAAEHDDITAYSEGKSAFIDRILDVARTDDTIQFEFSLPDSKPE
ncbi:GrpB family protein [Haloferax sp. S1W]|uniref:GrpB family protein n=1 Tax=Haloferax sp. S1W TaxID=3377110 RepID=UPI0037CBEB33